MIVIFPLSRPFRVNLVVLVLSDKIGKSRPSEPGGRAGEGAIVSLPPPQISGNMLTLLQPGGEDHVRHITTFPFLPLNFQTFPGPISNTRLALDYQISILEKIRINKIQISKRGVLKGLSD